MNTPSLSPTPTIKRLLQSLVLLTLLFAGGLWHSQTASAAGGITVAPAFLRVSVSNKQPVQDVAVAVKNNFSGPIALDASISSVDQRRGLLVPTEKASPDLTNIVSVVPAQFELQPGQSINLSLKITNSIQLSPGGHYAALLIKQAYVEGSNVPLKPILSISLYVIKEDGAVRKISLLTPELPSLALRVPKSVDLTFQNIGNVDVVPRATLLLAGHGGQVYAKGVVNEESIPVFPNGQVKLRSTLTTLHKIRWPGRYQLYVQYRSDGQKETKLVRADFLYTPWWSILGFLVFINLIIFGLLRLDKPKLKRKIQKRWKNYNKWPKKSTKSRQKSKKMSKKAKKIPVHVVEDLPEKAPPKPARKA